MKDEKVIIGFDNNIYGAKELSGWERGGSGMN